MSLLSPLRDIEKLKRHAATEEALAPEVAMLRAWQSQRLARTYADLLAQPRYRLACLFFLEEIYAPRDFSQRDRDIEQMYDFARRFIPAQMLKPLALTVELHHLTEVLDRRLLEVLVNELGVTGTITVPLYAEAYRRCDNYTERVQQIELIHAIGKKLDGLVRSPIVGAMLTVAKGPARQAGWTELTDFLEHGYTAFKHMHGGQYFLTTIREREINYLDRMYAHDPDPFGFDTSDVSEAAGV